MGSRRRISSRPRNSIGHWSRNVQPYSILIRFSRMNANETVAARRAGHTEDILEENRFLRVRVLLRDDVEPFVCQAENANALLVASTVDFDHVACVLENARCSTTRSTDSTHQDRLRGKEAFRFGDGECLQQLIV